jgi:hypothetical protein
LLGNAAASAWWTDSFLGERQRRIARLGQPGCGGSGVLCSDLDAGNADAVIAAQVRLFASQGEDFERERSFDKPADLADRLTAAGSRPTNPSPPMIAATAEISDERRSAELPPDVWSKRPTDEAEVDRLIRVGELVEQVWLAGIAARATGCRPGDNRSSGRHGRDETVCSARVEFLPDTESPRCRVAARCRTGAGVASIALARYRAELAAAATPT